MQSPQTALALRALTGHQVLCPVPPLQRDQMPQTLPGMSPETKTRLIILAVLRSN